MIRRKSTTNTGVGNVATEIEVFFFYNSIKSFVLKDLSITFMFYRWWPTFVPFSATLTR